MLGRLIPIPLPPKTETDLRDALFDRLHSKSFWQLVGDEVDAIIAAGAGEDHPAIADPALARTLRLMAAAHNRAELEDIVTRNYLAVLHRTAESFEANDDLIDGGAPVAPLLAPLLIGLAAGVAATWIYDEFIEGDETYTTTITDSDGTDWVIVTDENGRVISITRKEEAGSGP